MFHVSDDRYLLSRAPIRVFQKMLTPVLPWISPTWISFLSIVIIILQLRSGVVGCGFSWETTELCLLHRTEIWPESINPSTIWCYSVTASQTTSGLAMVLKFNVRWRWFVRLGYILLEFSRLTTASQRTSKTVPGCLTIFFWTSINSIKNKTENLQLANVAVGFVPNCP